MRYFQKVDGLGILECQEKWEDIRPLLHKNWKQYETCPDSLIRLMAECWYVLTLWDCCICKEKLSYEAFKTTLLETVTFGVKHFKNYQKFLCMAGYMISVRPDLFCTKHSDTSYSDWKTMGIDMLQSANRIDPYDAVANILYLGTTSIQANRSVYQKALE